jgi:hypothetical protein
MNNASATDKDSIVNFCVAPEQYIVGQNDVICNPRVMAKMRSHHEQIIRSNTSVRAFFCAPVDRAVLTYYVVIPDLYARGNIRIEGQILRKRSNDCSVANSIIIPYTSLTADYGVALNFRAGADSNATVNQGVRPDFYVRVKLRLGIDNCSGVNHFPILTKKRSRLSISTWSTRSLDSDLETFFFTRLGTDSNELIHLRQ